MCDGDETDSSYCFLELPSLSSEAYCVVSAAIKDIKEWHSKAVPLGHQVNAQL